MILGRIFEQPCDTNGNLHDNFLAIKLFFSFISQPVWADSTMIRIYK